MRRFFPIRTGGFNFSRRESAPRLSTFCPPNDLGFRPPESLLLNEGYVLSSRRDPVPSSDFRDRGSRAPRCRARERETILEQLVHWGSCRRCGTVRALELSESLDLGGTKRSGCKRPSEVLFEHEGHEPDTKVHLPRRKPLRTDTN